MLIYICGESLVMQVDDVEIIKLCANLQLDIRYYAAENVNPNSSFSLSGQGGCAESRFSSVPLRGTAVAQTRLSTPRDHLRLPGR